MNENGFLVNVLIFEMALLSEPSIGRTIVTFKTKVNKVKSRMFQDSQRKLTHS
jgi:hypothetical protein